jgi:hypothetical protein
MKKKTAIATFSHHALHFELAFADICMPLIGLASSHAGPGASPSSTSSLEPRAKCRHSMALVGHSQSFSFVLWSITE